MAFEIASFIQENFVRPITDSSVPGYNPVNTLTYGIILLALSFYVIYPYLNKRGIKFDFSFLKTIFPFILFGSSLRVLEDQHFLIRSASPLNPGFYFFTPGIWFLTFALVVVGMLLAKWGEKKLKWNFFTALQRFGILIAILPILWNILQIKEWVGGIGIILLTAAISFIVFAIGKHQKWKFFEGNNGALAKAAFVGQMLDASATFIALQFFGCGEQHVLPRLLFGAFGPGSFFFIKIPLMLLVLHYIQKEFASDAKADHNLHGFILLFLCILGFATGTRDLLTVIAGTCS